MLSTDPDRWVGFTSDPALTERWCAWLHLGRRLSFYVAPWRVWMVRD